ncbi:MAG: hypothetical protein R2932_34375 [Caldilineaceae bacterium]
MKPNRSTHRIALPRVGWQLSAATRRWSLPILFLTLFGLFSTGCAIPLQGIITAQEGINNGQPSAPIIAVAPEFGVPGTAIAVAGRGGSRPILSRSNLPLHSTQRRWKRVSR